MSEPKGYSSWWMRIWHFLRFMLILTVIVGVCYFAVFETDWFIVKEVELDCNNDSTHALTASFEKHFEGQNIFLISMREALDELEKNPYVARLELKRVFPDKILYRASMREEKAAFYYNGMYLLLDGEGMLLRISSEDEGYLVLEGFHVKSFVIGRTVELDRGDALENALRLINLVEQSDYSERPRVFYENDQITLRLNEAFRGKFGNGEEIERKYNAFMDIYGDLQSKGIHTGVIDVSHKGYPVYKPFGE